MDGTTWFCRINLAFPRDVPHDDEWDLVAPPERRLARGSVLVPDGLKLGDTYHLVFGTEGTRDATHARKKMSVP